MNRNTRILIAVSSVLLMCVFFVPVWSIKLIAPQYPEGLGLTIWMDTIDGQAPHDLQKINGLNHYIGMKPIIPSEIPELRIMPVALGVIIALGLLVAVAGSRRLLKAWVLTFIIFGISGLTDFYRWGYDYGHHLNPEAPIKVPGMSYQPPLIGTKKLLNFTASSLPATGAFFAGTAFVLGLTCIGMTRSKGDRYDA